MNYIQEATKLVSNSTELTVSDFEKLIELRGRAQGREAALIHRIVETFIMQVPSNVLNDIVDVVRF